MKICNIMAVGRFKFTHNIRGEQMGSIIQKGKLNWNIINEDTSPMLIVRKNNGDKIFMTIWYTGSYHTVSYTHLTLPTTPYV